MPIGQGTAMAGENGDRKFTVGANNWRARVRKIYELPTGAPMSTDAPAIPSAVGFVVSVALLDAADKVAVDASGRFMIFDPRTATFQQEFFENGLDVGARLLAVVEERILAAEKQLGSRKTLKAASDLWKA